MLLISRSWNLIWNEIAKSEYITVTWHNSHGVWSDRHIYSLFISLFGGLKRKYQRCTSLAFCNGNPLVVFHTTSQHDDVIKWKHFPRYWPFVRGIHRSPVNSPHKGQRRGALMFSLISAQINGWADNREAGDLRRIRLHYDDTVMRNAIIVSIAIMTTSASPLLYMSWNSQRICGCNVRTTNSITTALQWRHNSTGWRLKSPMCLWFAEPFVQVQTKENIKATPHWSQWG